MSIPLNSEPLCEQRPGSLDFVCSQMLSIDRTMPKTLAQFMQRLCICLFSLFLFLFALVAMDILADSIFRPEVVSRITLAMTVFSLAFIPFLMLLLSGDRGLMKFPSNIRINDLGLRFLWIERDLQSHLIPWAAIQYVGLRDNYLDLVINTNYSEAHWYQLLFETASLWRRPSPVAALHGKFNPACLHISFPLDSLTLDSDRQKLIAAISSNLDARVIDQSLSLLSSNAVASGASFTLLWLDDLHSGNRTHSEDLAQGATLKGERYRVVKIIGSGGQAKIYRAIDNQTGEEVVLKEIVLPMQAGLEHREKTFNSARNEADLLQRLQHPGIVRLLDNFVEDHRAYLVLENIDGLTLRQIVQERGPLDDSQVRTMAVSLAQALRYLHSASPPVVHRDLSPDNLLVDKDGQLKLIDFSVAQDRSKVASHTVVGRSNYIAPEQFKGNPLPQSDLYSLGATLYFLLTGSDPIPISTSRPSEKLDRECSLDEVVARLTEMDWQKRYATAEDLLCVLT